MVKLLVTGGAGFIGSNFIRHILKEHPDWYIVNLDKLTYAGNLENLKDVEDNPRYRFVRGDIADRELVDRLFREEKFDLVANLAAESHVDRSILDPAPFIETNVKGTQVLLEAARQHGVRKFLQVSTDEVYGSLQPDDPPFTEESPIRPNSPYSASKAAADLMGRAYFVTYGLPVVITRCSNNYGPYQHPEKFIPTIILNALADKPIPVYGDGQNVRDWIHVEDHCRALDLVLEKGRPGEVYNIGAGNEKNNVTLVRAILQLIGNDESLITFVKDRPGHDYRYAIDASKIQHELGWQPSRVFEKSLQELISWYKDYGYWGKSREPW
ncbi:dTDP-glucose 4,6-dehydratase [Neomoorella thermoacetica]|uniref:dTDP-glucose 4,6-dehydratase n=1 Tax=Neomoorella thermoacetica TaxID=1525 RepID=UPI0030D083BC